MSKASKNGDFSSDLTAVFFPHGTAQFLTAAISMTLGHTCLVLTTYEIFLSGTARPESELNSLYMLLIGAVSLLLFFHPTFMVTRGKRWAHDFLKLLSNVYLGLFAVAASWMLISEQQVWWVPATGFGLVVIAACMYRTKGFNFFRNRFERLWSGIR